MYAEGEDGEVRKDVCDVGSEVVNEIGGMMGREGEDEITEKVGMFTGTFNGEYKGEGWSSDERC